TVTATDIHGNTTNCSFTVTVILDHPPVTGSINLGAVANHPRMLLIDKVLGEASDSDNNTLTLTSVSANSTNGGTVTLTELNTCCSAPVLLPDRHPIRFLIITGNRGGETLLGFLFFGSPFEPEPRSSRSFNAVETSV